MRKVHQYVVFDVKDAKFYMHESVFQKICNGDERVFMNFTPTRQLIMSDICIRNNTIVKCRYDVDQIFETFLGTLPLGMEEDVLPYKGCQIKLIFKPEYESHPWECPFIFKDGTIHSDPTSWADGISAIRAAKQTIDTMLGENSEDILQK
jgi:hypothetical protein